jgi:dUTP pyrophosphatase
VGIPEQAYSGDAGFDLQAAENRILAPGERALIPTGLALSIPDGHAGLVLPRSGLAIKQGLSLVNTPGLIDSHYRGEISVIAINHDTQKSIQIESGQRIAQLLIIRLPSVRLEEVEELDMTDRGDRGFGSSGTS